MSVIQYGLTMENQSLIIEKAKSKRDGIYKLRGVTYRVINNHAVFYAVDGEVIQMCYGFNAVIGRYEHCTWSDNERKALKAIDINNI
tara:strand:- start:401 stop:661 length:261 start_codon:yes stop_codon:yes gene_type:complete